MAVLNGSGQNFAIDMPARYNVGPTNGGTWFGTVEAATADSRGWHVFDTINLLWWKRNNPMSTCWSTHELDSSKCTQLTTYVYESASCTDH